ncbi:unnamed protein product [Linum trigynum]|uniref:Uncharacterized protein n=1 Tax=Linum trigynum TaxID=586398 RepID=A0AAV2GBQ8_9ROSI
MTAPSLVEEKRMTFDVAATTTASTTSKKSPPLRPSSAHPFNFLPTQGQQQSSHYVLVPATASKPRCR